MRYCPRCGTEYRPGFSECSDCHIPLVDEPPAGPLVEPGPEVSDDDDEFDETLVPRVVLVYWIDRFRAEVMRSVLEGSGVAAFVAKEGYAAAYPLTVGYIGEGRVKVGEQDTERAADVVRAAVTGELDLEGTYEPGLGRPLWFRILAKVFCGLAALVGILGQLPVI